VPLAVRNAAITGWGMYVPDRVLTNADLEQMVETSDDWIVSRTGIRERRLATEADTTLAMSARASRQAIEVAGIEPGDIDLIVLATVTPDKFMPSTASLLQTELGAYRAAAFDLAAACSGFVYALAVGSQFIQTGVYRNVLVVGTDALTRFIDFNDRGTCILFGDGSGAVVLQATDANEGVLSNVLGSDGRGAQHLYIDGFASNGLYCNSSHSYLNTNGNGAVEDLQRTYMKMNGNEVFRFSVRVMGETAVEAVNKAGLRLGDIDWLIPHQANLRIIDAAAKRLDLPRERVWVNLDRYGNTSAASVPICLAEAADSGKLQPGMNLVLVAFGAGLSWASSVVRWGTEGVRGKGTARNG
jgi:3-oxoacyl-[acyl-carrier-protein] synthase III